MSQQLHTYAGPDDGNTLQQSSSMGGLSFYTQAQDLAGMGMTSSLLPGAYPTDPVFLGPYGRQVAGTSTTVEQWCRDDSPWTPKDLAFLGGQTSMNNRSHGPNFSSTYRESIPPSECDTAPAQGLMPSDSGYGSGATASICFEENHDSQETQSLAGQFSNLGGSLWTQTSTQERTASLRRPTHPDVQEIVCHTCNKTLRTKSELKKHEQRHTKPHRCDVAGCPRTEGFSTSNDLDRHKRSVHPNESNKGDRYNCSIDKCQHKEKIWPRADNFRAHVKRCHQRDLNDEELDKFVYGKIAPADVLSDIAGMEASVVDYNFQLGLNASTNFATSCWSPETDGQPATLIPHETAINDQQLLEHQMQRDLGNSSSVYGYVGASSHDETQMHNAQYGHVNIVEGEGSDHFGGNLSANRATTETQFVAPEELSHRVSAIRGAIESIDDRSPNITTQARSHEVVEDPSNSEHDDATTQYSTPETREDTELAPPIISIPTAEDVSTLVLGLNDPEKIKLILEALQSKGLLEELGYKKEQAPRAESKASESTGRRYSAQTYCAPCNKTFSRPCELKKHQKRHDKPYGCTFAGCSKRFGSKNDWKRHENSQHFILEVWKCNVRVNQKPVQICSKVSHRREVLKQHLANSHNITGNAMEQKLSECHVGRNGEANFWCGFCEEVIQSENRGLDAWTERFNHIDDHLSGRNGLSHKQMDHWKSVDPEVEPLDLDQVEEAENNSVIAVSISPDPKRSSKSDDRPRTIHRSSSSKRRADGLAEGRQPKRPKIGGQEVVSICCQCGEGNTRSRMSPNCINGACQHNLCNNCY